MIIEYGIDIVIFLCSWVTLFVWLFPKAVSMSKAFVNSQSAIDHAEHYYSFCPIGLKEKYKNDIERFTQEKWRAYKRIVFPFSVACVILAFSITYIMHALLWG